MANQINDRLPLPYRELAEYYRQAPEVERAVAEALANARAEISAIDREIALVQRLMYTLSVSARRRASHQAAATKEQMQHASQEHIESVVLPAGRQDP